MEKLEKFKVLSSGEILKVHENSLHVLEKVGLYIYSRDTLKILSKLGLQTDFNTQIVRFPKNTVVKCLKNVPEEFKIYDAKGELSAELGKGNIYTASGHNAIFLKEYNNDERRNATKADVGKFALISDYLPDIDIVGIEAMPQDVNAEASLLHAFEAVVDNTQKPVFFSPERLEVAYGIFEIAKVVMDGSDLKERPFIICQLSPTSPLTWEKGTIEALVETAKQGVPLCILPQPFAGVSSPYTLAGLLTVHNTECLSGIVLSQIINPGSPVIYGSAFSTFDMRTANVLIGSPETALLRIAGSQMAEFYHIPYHTVAPDTDAHVLDEQLSWEKFCTAFCAYLANSDLIVNGGMFSTGLTVSFEQLVIDNEIFSYIKRFFKGIKLNEDTLALDLIKKIGPKGNYLGDEHTLNYLGKGEHWEPMISSREIYENWRNKGKRDILGRANEKVDSILKSHRKEGLPDQKRRGIEGIIKGFENSI